jgi:hypothetical protein
LHHNYYSQSNRHIIIQIVKNNVQRPFYIYKQDIQQVALTTGQHTANQQLTQNGHDNVVTQNFNRPSRDKVERIEDVTAVNQDVTGRYMSRLEFERQGT